MKKIAVAMLLSAFVAAPAFAAGSKASVGANYSIDSVFGIQGEMDISSMVNKAPISVQAFWKNYSQNIAPGATWGTTGIGVAAIYDFSSVAKLDKKVMPYAGVGLIAVSYTWKGTGAAGTYTGVGGGLYFTGGVRYALTPQVAADFNYNNFGSLTVGANISF